MPDVQSHMGKPMSEQLYKAVVRTKLSNHVTKMIQLSQSLPSALAAPPSLINAAIDHAVSMMRDQSLDRAKKELADKADHLLNVYVDCDRTTYDVTITYVFDDKDTAVMFKLAQ